MRATTLPRILALAATVLVILSPIACGDGPTDATVTTLPQAVLLGTGADPSPICSPVTAPDLLADEGTLDVGAVRVGNDESTLFVTLETEGGWVMTRTHVFVAPAGTEIPVNNGGNPQPGRFPWTGRHGAGTTSYTYAIPLADLGDPAELVVAAHADVELGDRTEGAWGDGDEITPGGSWATSFGHTVGDCASELVTVADGGTVEISGVTLTVPPNSVPNDVQITVTPVDPSTLSLPSSTSGTGLQAAVQLGGVQVVSELAWDFGPDGLTFSEPAIITLPYDEGLLPEGFDEGLLQVFVINGIFDGLPSTVDQQRNEVTAEVPHFSNFFVGAPEIVIADLDVVLYEPTGPHKVGQVMEFGADVDNLGPDAMDGSTLQWTAFGNVTLEGVYGLCTEIQNPLFGTVAVQCPVSALASGGTDGIGVFRIIPQSTGQVEVWATVGDPAGAVDLNGDNDRETFTAQIEPAVLADLTLKDLAESGDPVRIGEATTYTALVQNLGPDAVSGAFVGYQASGPASLGALAPGCQEVTPIIFPIAVSCEVGALDPAQEAAAPPFELIPTGEGEIFVRATVNPAPGETEADGTDNFRDETTTVLPDGDADYAVTSLTESADPAPANEIRYAGTVELLSGPLAGLTGGTYKLIVDGQIDFLDDGGAGCSVISLTVPARVEVTCPLGTLVPGGSRTFDIGFVATAAPQALSATAWVTPPFGVTDTDGANDQLSETTDVRRLVSNLFLTLIQDDPDPVDAGSVVDYLVYATSNGDGDDLPGAYVRFRVQGDVELESMPSGLGVACDDLSAAAPEPILVHCDIEPMKAGIASPPLQLGVRALGGPTIEVEAEVQPFTAYADDPDLSDNVQTETTAVLESNAVADLATTSLTEPASSAKVGTPFGFGAEVTNNGPDASPGTTYYWSAFGDVSLGTLPAGCTEVFPTLVAPVEVECAVGPLGPGQTTAVPTFEVIPHFAGTLEVWGTVGDPDGGTDPVTDNDRMTGEATVDPLVADLFLTLISDSPDPVPAGEVVEYGVYALSGGTDDDMPSVVVQMRVFGDAELVSMPSGLGVTCSDLTGAGPADILVSCSIEPLQAGIASPELVLGVRALSGPTLTAEAEIFAVSTFATDPDLSDNLQSETTDVGPAPSTATVYVSSRGDHQVTAVDPNTNGVLATIPVGPGPQGMRVTPDGSELWVASRSAALGQPVISIISTATNTVVGTILYQQAIRGDLFDIDFSPDGSTAYVTVNESGGNERVTVIDVATRALVTNVFLPSILPGAIRVLPDGSRAYMVASGAILVMDLATNAVGSIPIAGTAHGLTVATDGSSVYFTQDLGASGLLREIDTSTDALVGPGIAVGAAPMGVVLSPDGGTAYVADDNARLDFVDLSAGTSSPILTGAGTAPMEIDITGDGASLFVTDWDNGTVMEVDVATATVGASTPVGSFPGRVIIKN